MAGRFEIILDATGKFRWRLKSGGGEVIAQGRTYDSRESARQSIAEACASVSGAHVLDLTARAQITTPTTAPATR